MTFIRAALLLAFTFPHAADAETVTLHIEGVAVHAEIARAPQSRSQGLMQRTQLCRDCGMLFIFPEAGRYAFWMKNTPLPLSIAFIAADGTILNIAEMQPNTTDAHIAHGDALYALEMNRGWFAQNNVKPGYQIKGLPSGAH